MKRVYISGPMTGYPLLNRIEFNRAEDALRIAGYDPINPSSNGLADDAPYDEHMRADLRMLLVADMVATLPGCEQSRGSGIETRLAAALGMPVHPIDWYVNPKAGGCDCPWCRDEGGDAAWPPTRSAVSSRAMGARHGRARRMAGACGVAGAAMSTLTVGALRSSTGGDAE